MPTEDMLSSNDREFEQLFKQYFQELHHYAFRFFAESEVAEEVVQQVFIKIWEKNAWKDIHSSAKAYLYRSVYNESMNMIKREKVRKRYMVEDTAGLEASVAPFESSRDLEAQLHKALLGLPEKTRVVFQMSRFEDLKYREIADQLNLSVKTVEGHITRALKHLRISLGEYLALFIFLFMER